MGIGNGATLEMVENLLDGSVPAGRALQADSAASADRAAKDGQGNVISSTYATKSELAAAGGFDAGGTYPNLTAGEAAHAEEADTASSAAYASSAGSADSAETISGTEHVLICFFAQKLPSVEIQASGTMPANASGSYAEDAARRKKSSRYCAINGMERVRLGPEAQNSTGCVPAEHRTVVFAVTHSRTALRIQRLAKYACVASTSVFLLTAYCICCQTSVCSSGYRLAAGFQSTKTHAAS